MPPKKIRRRRSFERASSSCSHAGGVKVAARNLLAEPQSAGNETWNTLVVKFPSEDNAAVSAAAAEAVLASATEGEDENAPPMAPGRQVRLGGALRRHQLPKRPLRRRKRRSDVCSPAIHHPHRYRAEGVRKGHDSLLAENRRRAVRVPARVLAALLAVEPHRIGGNVPAGWRAHDMEEAHRRRVYATVAVEVGGGQPRGEAV